MTRLKTSVIVTKCIYRYIEKQNGVTRQSDACQMVILFWVGFRYYLSFLSR